MTQNFLIRRVPVLTYFFLFKIALLDLVSHEFGQWYCRRRGITRAGRHVINDEWLSE